MIFVTVGACQWPFDRLLRAVDALPGDEHVVLQCGPSELRPSRAECVDFVEFETLVDHVRRARIVVTHGGIGSILISLANGKRPVVVPRLRRFGEAVDDHQVESARWLGEAGLVSCVEEPALLGGALAEAAPAAGDVLGAGDSKLAQELGEYLSSLVHARAAQVVAATE